MKKSFFAIVLASLLFSSCSITDRAMQTPNHHIEFYKNDFEYSTQLTAEAKVVRVFGIDWSRLFGRKSAQSPIPVFGEAVRAGARSYALYNLMAENPGYDVVVYPQYEVRKFIVPLFYSKRTAKVTARLAKIK